MATIKVVSAGETATINYTPSQFWVLRHSPAGVNTYWPSIRDTSWAEGAFVYYPSGWGHAELRWDSYWAAAVAATPAGLYTVVSPKGFDAAALTDFCNHLPLAWARKMIVAYYQEPEDNLTTTTQIQAFKDTVHAIAGIVRPYGIRCGVEFQEWTLDPANTQAWAGSSNLARFVNPADVDNISWSIYEKNLKDRSQAQIDRVVAFMNRYPGITWDASACGIAVPGSGAATTAQRQLRAVLVSRMIDRAKTAGAQGFGWFDFPSFTTSLDYGSDQYLGPVLDSF